MGRRMGRVSPFLQVLILVSVFLFSFSAFGAKVTLDPENWGDERGKECVSCHKKSSSGLAGQWESSAHADAGVNCMDCHKSDAADVDSIEHEGHVIATIVSPKDCGRCHTTEYQQHKGSVHAEAVAQMQSRAQPLGLDLGGPAIKVLGCDQCHGSVVKVRGDGSLDPATWPNTGIGRINPDGSKGSCSSCHGRHAFSRAQARAPEACTNCHSGPESPDKEVYEASMHGILFQSHRDKMNLDKDSWVAGRDYSAAPTCVTCHMGAAGKLPSNHDVGMRNTWTLSTPVSKKQRLIVFDDGSKLEQAEDQSAPRRGSELQKADGQTGKVKAVATSQRRRQAMIAVCLECHSKGFSEGFMSQFDNAVELYNDKFGKPAQAIMDELYGRGVLTPLPFDEPIEFTYWELWHDDGGRARHGASMGSPDDVWSRGFYRVAQNFYSRFLPQVESVAGELGQDLINQYVKAQKGHDWLKRNVPDVPSSGGDGAGGAVDE
jgi:hydroxylamine dehydrogenase